MADKRSSSERSIGRSSQDRSAPAQPPSENLERRDSSPSARSLSSTSGILEWDPSADVGVSLNESLGEIPPPNPMPIQQPVDNLTSPLARLAQGLGFGQGQLLGQRTVVAPAPPIPQQADEYYDHDIDLLGTESEQALDQENSNELMVEEILPPDPNFVDDEIRNGQNPYSFDGQNPYSLDGPIPYPIRRRQSPSELDAPGYLDITTAVFPRHTRSTSIRGPDSDFEIPANFFNYSRPNASHSTNSKEDLIPSVKKVSSESEPSTSRGAHAASEEEETKSNEEVKEDRHSAEQDQHSVQKDPSPSHNSFSPTSNINSQSDGSGRSTLQKHTTMTSITETESLVQVQITQESFSDSAPNEVPQSFKSTEQHIPSVKAVSGSEPFPSRGTQTTSQKEKTESFEEVKKLENSVTQEQGQHSVQNDPSESHGRTSLTSDSNSAGPGQSAGLTVHSDDNGTESGSDEITLAGQDNDHSPESIQSKSDRSDWRSQKTKSELDHGHRQPQTELSELDDESTSSGSYALDVRAKTALDGKKKMTDAGKTGKVKRSQSNLATTTSSHGVKKNQRDRSSGPSTEHRSSSVNGTASTGPDNSSVSDRPGSSVSTDPGTSHGRGSYALDVRAKTALDGKKKMIDAGKTGKVKRSQSNLATTSSSHGVKKNQRDRSSGPYTEHRSSSVNGTASTGPDNASVSDRPGSSVSTDPGTSHDRGVDSSSTIGSERHNSSNCQFLGELLHSGELSGCLAELLKREKEKMKGIQKTLKTLKGIRSALNLSLNGSPDSSSSSLEEASVKRVRSTELRRESKPRDERPHSSGGGRERRSDRDIRKTYEKRSRDEGSREEGPSTGRNEGGPITSGHNNQGDVPSRNQNEVERTSRDREVYRGSRNDRNGVNNGSDINAHEPSSRTIIVHTIEQLLDQVVRTNEVIADVARNNAMLVESQRQQPLQECVTRQTVFPRCLPQQRAQECGPQPHIHVCIPVSQESNSCGNPDCPRRQSISWTIPNEFPLCIQSDDDGPGPSNRQRVFNGWCEPVPRVTLCEVFEASDPARARRIGNHQITEQEMRDRTRRSIVNLPEVQNRNLQRQRELERTNSRTNAAVFGEEVRQTAKDGKVNHNMGKKFVNK